MKFRIQRNSIKSGNVCVAMMLLGLVAFASTGAFAETLYLVRPHSGVEVFDSNDPAHKMGVNKKAVTTKGTQGLVDFTIEYMDAAGQGFNDFSEGAGRKARLEDAVRYVLQVVNTQIATGLDILVNPSVDSGGTLLATAGPVFRGPGFTNGFAFERLTTGLKPNAGNAEIEIQVDFSHTWNLTTGPPATTEVDFVSVMVHELTHGLGIVSLVREDGNSQVEDALTVWDSLVVRDSTGQEIFGGDPLMLIGGLASLTSEDLAFDGSNAVAMYGQGGVSPPVHAPFDYFQGSSISHWDRTTLVGDAVMTQTITVGPPTRRTFAPIDLGALIDIGYADAVEVEGDAFLSVSPSGPIDFGTVELGSSASATWTVRNVGEGTLSAGVSSDNPAFEVVGESTHQLESGESNTFGIFFTPTVDGVQSGTLTFSGGANGDITVSVSGTGEELVVVLVPQLSVNTGPSQTFGAIDEGTTSPPFTWTIRNIGTGTLTWSATTSNPQFLFGTSETANGTLAEGASDSVAVFFTAPGPGAFSGQMIFSNDSVGSTQSDISVPVAGAGIALKGSSCSTASGGAAGSRAGDVLLVGLVLAGLVHRRRREAAVARCRE